MLERLALPTRAAKGRLTLPGVSRDAQGVALGPRGLLLFASIERALRWLAIVSREGPLVAFAKSLEVLDLRSKLGLRELAVTFDLDSSERMDHAASAATLVGGLAFTGAFQQFVQYRDADAPYGYDPRELLIAEASWVLYHQNFTQAYEVTRTLPLRALLSRMMLEPAKGERAGAHQAPGATEAVYAVAEEGLGPTLSRYLLRSDVSAAVTVGEWPKVSALDPSPLRRYVVRAELPARMREPLRNTPGLTLFVPACAGAAVEVGYRHPVSLSSLAIFDDGSLTLFRAGHAGPWVLPRFGPTIDLRAFAPVALRAGAEAEPVATTVSVDSAALAELRTPLRVVRGGGRGRAKVSAVWLRREKLPLLRRLAYALPGPALDGIRVAIGARGVVLRAGSSEGEVSLPAIPLGTYFYEPHPSFFLPLGFELSPAVGLSTAARAFSLEAGQVCFLTPRGRALRFAEEAFVPLVSALVSPPAVDVEALAFEPLARAFEEARIDLRVAPLGPFPLRDLPAPDDERDG